MDNKAIILNDQVMSNAKRQDVAQPQWVICKKRDEKAVAEESGPAQLRNNVGFFSPLHHTVALRNYLRNWRQASTFVASRGGCCAQPCGGVFDKPPITIGYERLHGITEFLDTALDRMSPVCPPEIVQVGIQSLPRNARGGTCGFVKLAMVV
jgi:hypothetical protein